MNQEWVEEVDVDRVQEVKERFLQLHGVLSIQDFICGWFHGAPYDQIHRGNVLDFVAYGFYSKQPKDLSPKVGALHCPCQSLGLAIHLLHFGPCQTRGRLALLDLW